MPSVTVKCANAKSTQVFGAAHQSGIGMKSFMLTLFRNTGGSVPQGSDGSEWQTACFRVAGTGEDAPKGLSVTSMLGAELHDLLVATFKKPLDGFEPELPDVPGVTWHVTRDGETEPSNSAAFTCASGAETGKPRETVSQTKESLIPGGIFMVDEIRNLLFTFPSDVLASHNLQSLLVEEKYPTGTWFGVTHINNLRKATAKV